MQKKYFYLSLTFNAVVILTFIFFTFIYPRIHSRRISSEQKFQQTLSGDQKQALDSLAELYRQMEFPLRVQNIEHRLHLWELLMQDQLDTMKIKQVRDSLMKAEETQKILRFEHFLKEKYLLRPDQRKLRLEATYLRLRNYLQELTPPAAKP